MIDLIIVLVIFGAILYLLNLVPVDAVVKQVIRVLVIVFLVIFAINALLQMTGTGGRRIRILSEVMTSSVVV